MMRKITLLTTLLTTTILTTANAELIDPITDKTVSAASSVINKTQETDNVDKLANINAYWITPPEIRLPFRYNSCHCTESGKPSSACYTKKWGVTTKLTIDKLGNITTVDVVKSDTNRLMERRIIRSLKRGKLMPFRKNGKAVLGQVTAPITIVNPLYNPNLQCPVVDSGEIR